jgi:hypothetical protein
VNLPTCEICGKPANKSAVINDFYYKHLCTADYEELIGGGANSGQARYNRDRDGEEHEADIIQPWNGDGKPSAEFLRLYPTQSRTMFGEDGMRAAERA